MWTKVALAERSWSRRLFSHYAASASLARLPVIDSIRTVSFQHDLTSILRFVSSFLQLLTFCSEMDGHALETFNTADADTKMQNIIQDLRLLIQNLML